ncbi:uncharacterized protein TNCT_551271 [Trichonephila clavata]|uniref:Uncharacterized protein n=1 Tax=Trichonephila clavata TaxID=2740835 RepID=A0A8X6FTB7_TRICU|nr:uncharacterized protein TNCT_551271 [Trichonephila clavata]
MNNLTSLNFFPANALEIIFETIIDVWNYIIFKYNMPVPSISIENLSLEFNKEKSNLDAVQEKLKITSNLIDFSDSIDKKRNHLTLFDDLSEETHSISSDLLTSDLPTNKSEPTSFQSIKFTRESSSENKNARDSCREYGTKYSSEPPQSFYPEKIFFNTEENNNTNNLLNILDFKNVCRTASFIEIPSPEQAKESKAIQTDDLETDLVKESSHQERSLISDIKNNASLITSYKSKERGEPQINSSCFSSAINAAISDLKGKEYGCSFENESMPFCNICNSIATQSESSSKDNKNSILLNDKDSVQKKVHFREEIETFLYEPKRCVHHPCVILKSPLSTKGMEEGNQNCKTTFTLEATVEENFHSYVVREDGEEIEEMFLENPNILETM